MSGAHFLFAAERIAIRAYYPCDLEHLATNDISREEDVNSDDDFDNLSSFLKSFQLALVFFILPTTETIFGVQLNNDKSYFHRAQRLVANHSMTNKVLLLNYVCCIGIVAKEKTHRHLVICNPVIFYSSLQDKNLRVLLLPTTESAVDSLIMIANSITLERKEAKQKFYQRLEEKYLLPQQQMHNPEGTLSIPNSYSTAASVHAAETIHTLASMFALPPGEIDVLMSMLKNLEGIATANHSILDQVPIEKRTKQLLQSFFGFTSHQTTEGQDNFLSDMTRRSSVFIGGGIPGATVSTPRPIPPLPTTQPQMPIERPQQGLQQEALDSFVTPPGGILPNSPGPSLYPPYQSSFYPRPQPQEYVQQQGAMDEEWAHDDTMLADDTWHHDGMFQPRHPFLSPPQTNQQRQAFQQRFPHSTGRLSRWISGQGRPHQRSTMSSTRIPSNTLPQIHTSNTYSAVTMQNYPRSRFQRDHFQGQYPPMQQPHAQAHDGYNISPFSASRPRGGARVMRR